MKAIFSLTVIFFTLQIHAQSSLVMNGGSVQLYNGAYLVINNNQPSAITVLNTGNGIKNDATSFVRWNIGSNASTYTVPFYFNTNYIPLSFSTSAAAGSGYLDLGTYNVPTWKNSDYLPAGVSNVDRNGSDNSNHVIDRFWSISAGGYTMKPVLSNLVFTYRDAEWSAAGNSIAENLLGAQRWNSTLSKWSDYGPAGVTNISNNTVTVASVAAADLFQWWTLVDATYPLPSRLLTFKAYLQNGTVKLDWSTASEVDTKEFVVERAPDQFSFTAIGAVKASGNTTNIHTYSTIDPSPLAGTSFYRLKMVDNNGQFTYSSIAVITLAVPNYITVFPNPVRTTLNVHLNGVKAHAFVLTDAAGKIVRSETVSSPVFQINLNGFIPGTYALKFITPAGSQSIKIVKQ